MPGYSGTPLPKKLGIKSGFRTFFVNAPAEVLAELSASLKECEQLSQAKPQLDFAMLFTTSARLLEKEFARISKSLAPAGMLWVSWPKKSSGVKSDLDDNVVREIGFAGRTGRCEGLRGDRNLVRIEIRKARKRSVAGFLPQPLRAILQGNFAKRFSAPSADGPQTKSRRTRAAGESNRWPRETSEIHLPTES
jgi:hypothetical protein